MDHGDWTYVTLNSSQTTQPLNTASAFSNSLASPVGATTKRLQVALFDFSYHLTPAVNEGTYLVFMDVVVPSQVVGGELTSLLRTVHCVSAATPATSSHKGTYEPNNLQWVDAAGTGGGLNFITTIIYNAEPDPLTKDWIETTDLIGTTLVTLAFRIVD